MAAKPLSQAQGPLEVYQLANCQLAQISAAEGFRSKLKGAGFFVLFYNGEASTIHGYAFAGLKLRAKAKGLESQPAAVAVRLNLGDQAHCFDKPGEHE
jgi:hypothetical protein